jgi:hypothetical protein
MRPGLAIVAYALVLHACARAGFETSQDTALELAPIDAPDIDGARDHAVPPADKGPPPLVDGNPDQGPADRGLARDHAPPHVDAAPVGACAMGPVVTAYPGSQMVLCSSSGTLLSQCAASQSCEALNGWHLCSAAEYLARGGKTIAAPKAGWIAGCVRHGSTPTAPTNTTCGSCSGSVAVATPISWTCSAGTLNSSHVNGDIGLAGFATCLRVGVNDPATEGYWQPLSAGVNDAFAFCCQP